MKRLRKVFHSVENHTSCLSANQTLDDEHIPTKFKSEQLSRSQGQNESSKQPTNMGMTHEEFRQHGKEMIDFIADYLSTIRLDRFIVIFFMTRIIILLKILVNVV